MAGRVGGTGQSRPIVTVNFLAIGEVDVDEQRAIQWYIFFEDVIYLSDDITLKPPRPHRKASMDVSRTLFLVRSLSS